MSTCRNKYPYTCIGDNEPCSECGHLGKYHRFGNGKSICYKCELEPYQNKKRISGLKEKKKEGKN